MDNNITDFTVGTDKNPLRLLIMESLPKSAENTSGLLRKLGYTVEVKQVSNTEELNRQIEQAQWDLLISPPRFADSNASQILTILARHERDIPLLILAPDMSDPLVLDALQSGARDVISNEMPEYTGHTLKRELVDLAHRRAHAHFKKLSSEYHEKCENLMAQTLETSAVAQEVVPTVSLVQVGKRQVSATFHAVQQSRSPDVPHTKDESQAHKDSLTGLLKRQYFIHELKQLAAKTVDHDTHHALLVMGLDNFNAIKEQTGIAAADLLLSDIAKVISTHLETSSLATRYGDNSFAILLKDTTQESARVFATELGQDIAAHAFAVVGKAIPRTTCSIGISSLSRESSNIQECISRAQTAYTVAKSEGMNKVHLYDEKMDAQASVDSDKKWEEQIRSALKNNRFQLVFQPIVNLHSKPAENYEILLRMLDENNKEILPGEFIPAAEHGGLMPQVDQWVVENALIELAKRHVSGKQTTFFIKLSAMTLKDKQFPSWLSKNINAIKLPAGSVVFEISESIAIRHTVQVKKYINWLKTMRCSCAIDHFGTQPRSMEIIKELPADYLKIDRSFMHNLTDKSENKDRIKSIVALAQSVNKRTIAEFVQDANSLSILWQCGVDYIQGYFLQRPESSMMYDFADF